MGARVEMLNGITGTKMLVPEELVEQYVKAGHKPVKASAAPAAEKTETAAAPKKQPRSRK